MTRLLFFDGGGTIGQVRKSGRLGYIEDGKALSFLQAEERRLLTDLGVTDAVQPFNKDSTLVGPSDWAAIARTIHENAHRFDGFVISQGTDSLAYTASALSWMLGPLEKPVVLTGSMIPMRDDAAMGRTDGWANLVNAVRVAGAARIREVAIVFGNRILRGNRATKAGTFDLDGFASPNHSGLGYIGKDIAYAPEYRPPTFRTERIMIPDHWPTVGWVKSFPGLSPETIRSYLRQLEGCVLETFASGSLPLEIIDELHSAEIPSVMCLPGNQGPKDAFYFDPGLWVEDRLVASGRDMTREACVTKLMWALAVSRDKKAAVELLRQSVAGEMEEEIRPYYGIP